MSSQRLVPTLKIAVPDCDHPRNKRALFYSVCNSKPLFATLTFAPPLTFTLKMEIVINLRS